MAYKANFFLQKYLLKFLGILYAICKFKIHNSQPKLATRQILLA